MSAVAKHLLNNPPRVPRSHEVLAMQSPPCGAVKEPSILYRHEIAACEVLSSVLDSKQSSQPLPESPPLDQGVTPEAHHEPRVPRKYLPCPDSFPVDLLSLQLNDSAHDFLCDGRLEDLATTIFSSLVAGDLNPVDSLEDCDLPFHLWASPDANFDSHLTQVSSQSPPTSFSFPVPLALAPEVPQIDENGFLGTSDSSNAAGAEPKNKIHCSGFDAHGQNTSSCCQGQYALARKVLPDSNAESLPASQLLYLNDEFKLALMDAVKEAVDAALGEKFTFAAKNVNIIPEVDDHNKFGNVLRNLCRYHTLGQLEDYIEVYSMALDIHKLCFSNFSDCLAGVQNLELAAEVLIAAKSVPPFAPECFYTCLALSLCKKIAATLQNFKSATFLIDNLRNGPKHFVAYIAAWSFWLTDPEFANDLILKTECDFNGSASLSPSTFYITIDTNEQRLFDFLVLLSLCPEINEFYQDSPLFDWLEWISQKGKDISEKQKNRIDIVLSHCGSFLWKKNKSRFSKLIPFFLDLEFPLFEHFILNDQVNFLFAYDYAQDWKNKENQQIYVIIPSYCYLDNIHKQVLELQWRSQKPLASLEIENIKLKAILEDCAKPNLRWLRRALTIAAVEHKVLDKAPERQILAYKITDTILKKLKHGESPLLDYFTQFLVALCSKYQDFLIGFLRRIFDDFCWIKGNEIYSPTDLDGAVNLWSNVFAAISTSGVANRYFGAPILLCLENLQRGNYFSRIVEIILGASHETLAIFCELEFKRVLTFLEAVNAQSFISSHFELLDTALLELRKLLEKGADIQAHTQIDGIVLNIFHLRSKGVPEKDIQARFSTLFAKVIELINNESSFINLKLKFMATILATVATDKITSETFFKILVDECPLIEKSLPSDTNPETLKNSAKIIAFYIRVLIACHSHTCKAKTKIENENLSILHFNKSLHSRFPDSQTFEFIVSIYLTVLDPSFCSRSEIKKCLIELQNYVLGSEVQLSSKFQNFVFQNLTTLLGSKTTGE